MRGGRGEAERKPPGVYRENPLPHMRGEGGDREQWYVMGMGMAWHGHGQLEESMKAARRSSTLRQYPPEAPAVKTCYISSYISSYISDYISSYISDYISSYISSYIQYEQR
jgi:hypothetical protein